MPCEHGNTGQHISKITMNLDRHPGERQYETEFCPGVPLDPLAACIGYGIDLQEATDIIDLALWGRDGLNELQQHLYDVALAGIKAQEDDDDHDDT